MSHSRHVHRSRQLHVLHQHGSRGDGGESGSGHSQGVAAGYVFDLAAVELCSTASRGSVWLIVGRRPASDIVEVTEQSASIAGRNDYGKGKSCARKDS